MKIYKYDDCRVAEETNAKDCILQSNFDFYKIPIEKKKEYLQDSKLLSVKELSDNPVVFELMTFTILLTLIIYFRQGIYTLADNKFIIATLFLLINIPLHEIGHILFLKVFYRESKIKVGFKFVFIYPAFYVDTSYSYLCPKYKRMSIYLAGNFMNCLFVLGVCAFFPQYISYCYIIISNILVNFIPIIKSDGYYAFVTLLDKYNRNKGKRLEYWDDFVRGLIMFVFMSVLSYIF